MERVIPTQLADLYPHIDLVESTGSTNADLLAGDAPHGAVLIARHQSAGRGRRGRQWSAPADTQLIFSVLLRVTDVERLGTLTLAAGLAVTDVIAPATLKWPNDVLIDGRKLCGILAEAASGPDGEFTVVVGVGLNHLLTREQLPVLGLRRGLFRVGGAVGGGGGGRGGDRGAHCLLGVLVGVAGAAGGEEKTG